MCVAEVKSKHFWRVPYMAAIFILLFILTGTSAIAQKKVNRLHKDTVELTQVDVSRLKEFDAQYASVFGISLFMSENQVKKALKKYPFLVLEDDKFNHFRSYLYKKSDTGKITLGYLKWYPKDTGLMEIVLYPEITPFLKGRTCSILSSACLDPESEVYKDFLKKPVDEDVVLNIPSINLKTTRYYYPELSLIIEVQQSGEEKKYNLILFKF